MEKKIVGIEPEMMVTVVSNTVALIDYSEAPDFFIDEYIGNIKEKYFYLEQKEKIKNKDIKQFLFIHQDFNTVFNYKQVKQLAKEIAILEQKGEFNKEVLEVIKKGIKLVLENKDLYLKFQYA